MQMSTSSAVANERASASGLDNEAVQAASEATEALTEAKVLVVCDDNEALAAAALRNALAGKVPHKVCSCMASLVVAGPFGIGKRQLLQRMLTLYPEGFCLPPVLTTNESAMGGQLTIISPEQLARLRKQHLLAFEEVAVGEQYAVSLEDVARCSLSACAPAMLAQICSLAALCGLQYHLMCSTCAGSDQHVLAWFLTMPTW